MTGHAWIQQGVMLICQSCKPAHSTAILDKDGMPTADYQLVGYKDGLPVFKKISVEASAPK